jgi:ATP-dependent RNA helicase DBP3
MKILSSFTTPTPIQSQCWPIILSGRDIVAIAETGSGKTLGFILPSLIHIFSQADISSVSQSQSNNKFNTGAAGPIALVLSPTRELAQQTSVVCESASTTLNSKLKIACIYGGTEKRLQRDALKNGCHIVVACPGRLLSLIDENIICIKRVTYMVLDEADRMLDMGFEPDIRAIMGHISPNRQTLMFSATWPTVIQKLASEFISNPVHVTIGRVDASELKANTRVKQTIQVMEDHEKQPKLISLLQQYCPSSHKTDKQNNRVIVFCLYKKEVDRIARFLEMKGFNNVVLSGDRTQADRERAIADFKSGKARLLIATDVAARGLDVNDVEHVINYTFPLTVEDYIHRIGRTGRAGKSGNAYTFFTKAEKGLSGALINVLRESNENVPEELMNFGVFTKKKEHGMYGAFFKEATDGQPMKAATRVKFD